MIKKTVVISLLLVTFHTFSSNVDNSVVLISQFTALQDEFSKWQNTLDAEVQKINNLDLNETDKNSLYKDLGLIFPNNQFVAYECRSNLGERGATIQQFVYSIAECFFQLNLNDLEDQDCAKQQINVMKIRLNKVRKEIDEFKRRIAAASSSK